MPRSDVQPGKTERYPGNPAFCQYATSFGMTGTIQAYSRQSMANEAVREIPKTLIAHEIIKESASITSHNPRKNAW